MTGNPDILSERDGPSTITLDREILSAIPYGSRVLESACAWGRTAFELEKMGYRVTAFDIDPEIVSRARKNADLTGSEVKLIVADGCDLPFGNGSFDACVMNGFLTMLDEREKREAAIKEAWRVLVPGGFLYIADFIQTWSDPTYAERYRAHFPITGEIGTFLATEDGSLDGKVMYRAHHHTVEELLELIGGGFNVRSRSKTTFTSYHGNRVDGCVILAQRSSG
ncbi:MAG: class I SAM-dependent methyltransferase [Thermoplasmatota archaeon]